MNRVAETARAVSPGRIEVLGNHTDYNEGLVILATIPRFVAVSGVKRADGLAVLNSDLPGAPADSFEIRSARDGSLEKTGRWSDYPRGVTWAACRAGARVDGFECRFSGDLPVGAGLGSSAAAEVAFCLFLQALFGFEMTRLEMARTCRRAENDFVGVASGILDQFACLFGREGHLVHLDCRTMEHRHLSLPAGFSLVLCDSGIRRELALAGYNRRREECRRALACASSSRPAAALRDYTRAEIDSLPGLPPDCRKRAAHVTGENERVEAARRALENGDAAALGRLMSESHESSRFLFENSLPELDFLVDRALDCPGVSGARLTGAGWGGTVAILVARGFESRLASTLAAEYRSAFGRPASFIAGDIAAAARVA